MVSLNLHMMALREGGHDGRRLFFSIDDGFTHVGGRYRW